VRRQDDLVRVARVDFTNPAGAIVITILGSDSVLYSATITCAAGPLVLASFPPLATGIDIVGTINPPTQSKVFA
jgi:hypothetical protein